MSRWPFRRTLRPGQVRSDSSQDIQDEIELYLDLRARELVDEGFGPEDARRIAEERFGDASRVVDELERQAQRRRAREGTTMTMSGLRQDLAYALRGFRRSPGFSIVAVVTLALALAGNTAIFSVVDAALLQALPFEDHEELVFLNGYHLVDGQISVRGASFPEFRDWRDQSRAVTRMAAVGSFSLAASGDGSAERVATEMVTEGYFDILGAMPVHGRVFLPEEHAEPDAFPVAVISDALWERRFARDPDAVGRDIVLNDRPLTVVGVMPAGFGGTSLDTDLWVPESMISLIAGPAVLDARGSRFLTVIGHLGPDTGLDAAQEDLDVIARGLQESFPRAHEDRFAQVISFREGYLGSTGGLLWILMGAGLLLLLIAAANVANLLLVRAHGRTREIVLRRALGAGDRRIASQLLTESLLLALIGGAGGLLLAGWALRVLGPMIPQGVLPGYVEPGLSATAFLFSLALLAFIGVATGMVPAVSSTRVGIAQRLREGAKASPGGPGRLRAQHVFVVTQVALALVLTVGAGLLTRSFRAQLAVDTGVDLAGITAMRLQLPGSRYDSDETLRVFASEVERAVAEIPGVESAAVSSDLPFRGGSSASYIFREGDGPDDRIRYHRHFVSPSYFETLGIEVVEGRPITPGDVEDAPGVIVITEAMAERVFPGESAVGKIMTLRPDGGDRAEIVGVVHNVRYRDVTTSLMADANSPDVFFSYRQIPSRGLEVSVRSDRDVAEIAPAMRRAVAELDADLPVFQLQALEDAWRAQTATPRFAAFLMTLFSVLAAVLACVGVYGVLAFAVGQRSQEIAIRRAIGATGSTVAASVLRDGLRLGVIGLGVGAVVAMGGSRVLEGFLFGVETTDPVTFAAVGGAMVAVAVVGAVVPAMRAMRRDPADALHAD